MITLKRFAKFWALLLVVCTAMYFLPENFGAMRATDGIPEFELITSAPAHGTRGACLTSIKDSIYIATANERNMQLFKLHKRNLISGEKFDFNMLPKSPFHSRASICRFFNDFESSMKISCNFLAAGASHNLQPLSSFISFGAGQPIGFFYENGERYMLVDDFLPGTDLLSGRIKIFRTKSMEKVETYTIEAYYTISRIESAGPRWLVLSKDSFLHLYNRDFTIDEKLNISCGAFELVTMENEQILLTTSGGTITKNFKDSLTMHRVKTIAGKIVFQLLGKKDFAFPIHQISTYMDGNEYLILLLSGYSGKEELKLYKMD